jgi:hypothetical protein
MANGMPKPMWARYTAANCPVRLVSLYSRSSGTRATWLGTTSSATMTTNRVSRNGNSMKVKA